MVAKTSGQVVRLFDLHGQWNVFNYRRPNKKLKIFL